MKKWQKDVIYGIVIIVLSVFLIIDTYNISDNFIQFNLSKAGVYSRFWLYLLLFLSIILIVKSIVKKNFETKQEEKNLAPLLTVLFLCFYLILLSKIGFIISTIIYLILSETYYAYKSNLLSKNSCERKKTIIHLVIIFVSSVAITLITYFVFTVFVGVRLPRLSI